MSAPKVIVVGAGFGGLAAAIELERAGMDYEVLERAAEVGGVWQANTYPGAACDVPSVIYQFSHQLNDNWQRRFGTQQEIRDYLRRVSIDTGVRERVRFGVEVVESRFSNDVGRWELSLGDGSTEWCDVLVCATGQLSRPSIPPVPGRDEFAGAQFHSAEWDHGVDLAGKRVVVVGSGASAVQIVPAIADTAETVTVIQRDPNWVVNKIDWTPPRAERLLAARVPGFLHAYHAVMWWWFESRYPVFVPRRMKPIRKLFEWRQRRQILRGVGGDRVLAAKLTPDYPLGCNRILLSREWYPTLARPDVHVVAAGVDEVTPTGMVCDGEEVAADVIVWSTGFTPTEYLAPMRVVGRHGREIREHWAEGPEAYLGLSTPGFPNLFMLYGPNTGSLTNTIVSLLEYQAGYVRQAVEHLHAHPGTLEVREEVHQEFNRELQHRLGGTVFTLGCPGWYTTPSGKVTTVWTGSHVEYRRRTRIFDATAYEHAAVSAPELEGATT